MVRQLEHREDGGQGRDGGQGGDAGHGGDGQQGGASHQGGDRGRSMRISLLTPPQV